MSDNKYPTHIEPRLLEVATWCREGLTEKQIARKLRISYSSFREHKKLHPALLGTLFENKGLVDAKVENALLQRALGQRVQEVTKELKFDRKNMKEDLIITKVIEKDLPPDVGAAKMWLVNRKKSRWCENPHGNDIKKEELEIRKKELESKEW